MMSRWVSAAVTATGAWCRAQLANPGRLPREVGRRTVAAGSAVMARVGTTEPRQWRAVGAGAATVLTVAVLGLTWQPNDTWAGTVPSGRQTVGTCHVLRTQSEVDSFSDVRPPVPCAQPHQSETVLTGTLTGALDTPDRMTPERRLMVMGQLCQDDRIRQYLGASARDELYAVNLVLRLPTQDEWDQGDRQYRCELVAYDPARPQRLPAWTGSLHNVFHGQDSAQLRHCWRDFVTSVPCDQPHRSESVWGIANTPQWIVNFGPPSQFNPAQFQQFQQWSAQTCQATVTEFLGRPIQRTPYHIEGHLSSDARVLWCAVATQDDQPPTTGTIAPQAQPEKP
jgi:hypothetical protein